MQDYFHTVEERPNLTPYSGGPKCYVDIDEPKKRLYSFVPTQVSREVLESQAYRQVAGEKARLSSDEGVYLVIDSNDWRGTREGEKHPAIIKDVFRWDGRLGSERRH